MFVLFHVREWSLHSNGRFDYSFLTTTDWISLTDPVTDVSGFYIHFLINRFTRMNIELF